MLKYQNMNLFTNFSRLIVGFLFIWESERMAKASIKQKQSLSISGILSVEDWQIEGDEIGVRDLRDLLMSYDGKDVSISVSFSEEIE